MRRSFRFLLLAASPWLPACERDPPPWAGVPDGGVIDESRPFLPEHKSGLGLGEAGGGDAGTEEAPEGAGVGRVGGLWLACHAGFRAEGNDPVPEVMRLGLSCGPQNGMRRRGGTLRGEVSAQGTPARRRFPVLAGECFRLVIVGQASLASWKVALTLPDRAAIEVAVASEDGRPGYAVVERERPFCATTGGGAELVVTAEVGAGTFAAQIWGMPPRGSP